LLSAILLTLIGVPLVLPALDLLGQPDAWQVFDEGGRLFDWAKNTLLLIAGTLALAMPVGIAGAVLLYRSDLPLSRFLRFVTVLTLFVPLPLFASAWQATLGAGGWLAPYFASSVSRSTGDAWQPWVQGMGAAIWVHIMAGLPWVIWIVGQGLSWVERDLEEDALLAAPPLQVLLQVTLPRCRSAIAVAALVVTVQTATEITVTDLMQVRTFAEEVYLQFSQDQAALARAVAVSLPSVLILAILLGYTASRWDRHLPALDQLAPPICLFRLGHARWPILAVVVPSVGIMALVPLLGLIWKAGLAGSPEVWSGSRVAQQLLTEWRGKKHIIMENLLLDLCAGGITAALALTACWLATESRWFRTLMLMFAAVAWAMPGPIVGLGLKATIQVVLSAEESMGAWFGRESPGPMAALLYDGPSLVPVLWVSLIRFFPVAVALLWPAVRSLPRELRDAARVDGAAPGAELLALTLPLTGTACRQAALAVAVLSLGELSAGKLVETPGSTTLAHVIFEQMHRGVPSDVAALGLLLLTMVLAVGVLVEVRATSRWRLSEADHLRSS
jgi:iron(III) transport system permease protein